MAQSNDLIELLRIILKWKKPILITCLIIAVLTAAYSWFFMPDYYKSSVTFYPSNPVMNDRQVLYSTAMGELKIDYFGSSSDVDRILTMAHTSSIEDYIINNFNLIRHYGYDSTRTLARYYTKKKFEKNYRAIETEYGAVEITIWDTDKDLAAKMANHIVETIDNHNKELIYHDKENIIETFNQQIDKQNTQIQVLMDSVDKAKRNGVSVEKMNILEKDLEGVIDNKNENERILEQYRTSANTNYSTVHITEEAYPALRKDKPHRSLIVLSAFLGSLLFMIILAVLVENYRKIKPRLHA